MGGLAETVEAPTDPAAAAARTAGVVSAARGAPAVTDMAAASTTQPGPG